MNLKTGVRATLLTMLGSACAAGACAQMAAGTQPTSKDVAVVMLSDIHFDPLHDPAKVARLAATPVEAWEKILDEADSPTQAAEFAAMQTECAARGVDPDNALLNSTLKAAQGKTPRFVTVTGDLLVHDFGCKYHAMTHGKAVPGTGTTILEKSVEYVMRRVEGAFPSVPVYIALGNNDSSCGDYKLNLHDRFLKATSAAVLHGLRGASAAELKTAEESYEAGGYYAVTLGGGVERTRLLVLEDIYNSGRYASCTTDGAESAAANELKWLDGELKDAETRGEKVWVIGHIPPGPDAFNTLKHVRSMCTVPATMFLSSEALADVLIEHAGVIRLAVFAHTHEDEMKLLEKEGSAAGGVAVKLVPAVSAINGNVPSFTVAQVDRVTATMVDYAVFMLPGGDAAKGVWTREYGFHETYHQPEFSAKTLRLITDAFQADKPGEKAESQAYMKYFYPGQGSPLFLVWPQYVCAMTHDREAEFKACMCGGK